MHKKNWFYFFLFLLVGIRSNSQTLSLKDAVQMALKNYGTVKAKANYLNASRASVKATSLEYLPNLNVAAQQAYGTANGQFGPLFASGGLNASSSGPAFPKQNWNAAFGALYLANINWDFFTFGRVQQKIKVAEAQVLRETNDLEQEKFQHQVRVASAYLNLLAAQRLKLSQQKNLDRANALKTVVVVRTKNGLNPGVDSSQANAEVSNAKIALTNAIDYEMEQTSQLVQLMGIPYQEFLLDTLFINRIPASLYDSTPLNEEEHPVLKFYQSRIQVSRQQEKYYDRYKYPVLSLIGVAQSRGSGFHNNYSEPYPNAFTHNYWSGIQPDRSNYLIGMGVTWNLTNIKRTRQQVTVQEWTSKGLQDEYEVINQQIKVQLALADQKMKNAIANYHEAPVQLKAASDAYLQKTVLYRNGLSNIVDVTQALYTLNRAETDRDISNNNVWQALLLKAAASGDFSLFMNEF
ncbi:TolC family protein [Chitinophagaceae bacterium LB-8]|uniref:TolC family protein n=1 Tax=Paraflavisolibacter caeni TaxID=2982496 RepID=A0A9X3BI52_9BACT|nr:TolC family protein [Paraflavisolibacter caeni]MCU7549698.1 TolC family protein [Paraflavisolibacter caeni]